MSDETRQGEEPRQRIERAPGRARRARLTPAPGSDPSPEAPPTAPDAETDVAASRPGAATSEDQRLTRDRPPHWRST